MKPAEYWTMFNYGSGLQICTKHKSLRAAEKSATECESRGGAKHVIAKVQWIPRKKKS